jgi:hypothetical protein
MVSPSRLLFSGQNYYFAVHTLRGRYAARIVETRLLGRCGITAYIVTLRDAAGSESTLYFDIDSGTPIHHNLLDGCPRHMSGSATVRGAVTDTDV